jgi:hypothetical protein
MNLTKYSERTLSDFNSPSCPISVLEQPTLNLSAIEGFEITSIYLSSHIISLSMREVFRKWTQK